ncbi:MAG: competence/damage-inducible protein A [Alphaproteobacteria bacterium]|nr:competence/damage-inducible protein A [Alphaproteobacteria bacterium]
MQTAAVIIIGNEILTGKFADENGPYLIRRLRELGVRLGRLLVIPDELPVLAEEIRRASEAFDIVITTGGVGPTHDDVTMRGVAEAFGVDLAENAEMIELFEEYRGAPLSEPTRRMACLPEGAELVWGDGIRFPLVVVRNVHILPGVPAFMQMKFESVAERWRSRPPTTARVTTSEPETAIAHRLEAAVARWPSVEIGSYPRYESLPYHVIVTLEGQVPEDVEACRAWLAEQLAPHPEGSEA